MYTRDEMVHLFAKLRFIETESFISEITFTRSLSPKYNFF